MLYINIAIFEKTSAKENIKRLELNMLNRTTCRITGIKENQADFFILFVDMP